MIPEEELRKFFRISNATFDCVAIMCNAFGGKYIVTPMHQLHKLALEEAEKEEPDMILIDKYLEQMQLLAQRNSEPKPDFPKGSIDNT